MKWFQKVLQIVTLGLYVVSTRSGKVRRHMGEISNWLEIIRLADEWLSAESSADIPVDKLKKEFGFSNGEALEFIKRYNQDGEQVVSFTGKPADGDAA